MRKQGRRPHQLCWDNVVKLSDPNGYWRCKHCNEKFSSGASRIRTHLSHQGKGIRYCEEVPLDIQEKLSKKRRLQNSFASGEGNEASKRPTSVGEGKELPSEIREVAMINSKKRGRNSGEGNDGISSEQEVITDAIVEFFVSKNIRLDAVKDPFFQTLLTRAVQPDVSAGIQNSLSNLEDVVNRYMMTVKESWKTTGCTLICYNLDELMGNPSNSEADSTVVYGFYCHKGFIFLPGPLFKSREHLGALNLPSDDVQHFIYHDGFQMCEFAMKDDDFGHYNDRHCSQQQFQQFWKSICTKSGWVRNFMHKSENLYEFLLDSYFSCEGWEKVADQNDGDANPWSAFTRLKSIMHFEDGIKEYLTHPYWEENVGDVLEIINDKEFWSDGKELLVVVTPLIPIIGLLDTLVPTGGYLPVAVQKAKDNLKPYYERDTSKYKVIWNWLIELNTSSTISNKVATCLSPFYDCGPEKWDLKADCVVDDEEEDEKFDAEAEVYKYENPFANLSSDERNNHPVTLWKTYGDRFPVLQKCAIKFFSQPTSCMCNQVKKHILHCQGSDNFILRLNYQMMQHFIKLGDTIYEPLGSRFFEGLIDAPHRISPPTSAADLSLIPGWMNEFILKSIDVVADGNCGYRAIAESVGLGQDKWREVRLQLYNELISQPQLYEPTFRNSDVETISKALLHNESGFAPPETWLDVTDMGLLVASTFKAKFVVMGSPTDICCTYLPLYLPEGWQFDNVPEIVVCLGYSLHFSSLSLTNNAPLPPISFKWERNCKPSTQGFDRFLSDRFASYDRAASQYRQRGKPVTDNAPLGTQFFQDDNDGPSSMSEDFTDDDDGHLFSSQQPPSDMQGSPATAPIQGSHYSGEQFVTERPHSLDNECSNDTTLRKPQSRSPLAPISPPVPAISTSSQSVGYNSQNKQVWEESTTVDIREALGSLANKIVNGPHIGQIPVWMNEFIRNSIDVVADGNCGYRAIAKSIGQGEDKWRKVREKLYNELRSQSELYAPTIILGNVETTLNALSYRESGNAPRGTWLEVTDMGLLVATTFKAKFVVMGPDICCTYLPLYLPEGYDFHKVSEIVLCLAKTHFSLLYLTENAPLPPVCNMWALNCQQSTEDLELILNDRLASYNSLREQGSSERAKTPPIEISSP